MILKYRNGIVRKIPNGFSDEIVIHMRSWLFDFFSIKKINVFHFESDLIGFKMKNSNMNLNESFFIDSNVS